MTLILVTGGIRSGKSKFAEELAMQMGGRVLYHATGIACDQEMEHRIALHRERRPEEWGLIEHSLELSSAAYSGYQVVLVDCLSTWVSNHLLQEEELSRSELTGRLETWVESVGTLPQTVIVVTSEVGLGGVAMSSMGRKFQDLLGESNQLVAQHADEVYAVMSGIPWRLK